LTFRDKLDKIGEDGVKIEKGIEAEAIEKVQPLLILREKKIEN
jgi:hypothetical protein